MIEVLICPHCDNRNIIRRGSYYQCVECKVKIELNIYGLPLNSSDVGCGFKGYKKEFFKLDKPISYEDPSYEEAVVPVEDLGISSEEEVREETLESLGIIEEKGC